MLPSPAPHDNPTIIPNYSVPSAPPQLKGRASTSVQLHRSRRGISTRSLNFRVLRILDWGFNGQERFIRGIFLYWMPGRWMELWPQSTPGIDHVGVSRLQPLGMAIRVGPKTFTAWGATLGHLRVTLIFSWLETMISSAPDGNLNISNSYQHAPLSLWCIGDCPSKIWDQQHKYHQYTHAVVCTLLGGFPHTDPQLERKTTPLLYLKLFQGGPFTLRTSNPSQGTAK